MMPLSAAASPPTLTWQYSLAIRVDPKLAISTGILRRSEPLQGPFLQRVKTTIGTSRRDALCNSVIIRGLWFRGSDRE